MRRIFADFIRFDLPDPPNPRSIYTAKGEGRMITPVRGCTITPIDPMPTPEELTRIYRMMVACREFEDRLYNLFLTESMPGTMHQYTGQEAVAVGICAALRSDDYITSTHRGHGHAVAKGVPLRGMTPTLLPTSGSQANGGLPSMARSMLPVIGMTGKRM